MTARTVVDGYYCCSGNRGSAAVEAPNGFAVAVLAGSRFLVAVAMLAGSRS